MGKFELFIQPPLMNAAGSLGFAPDPYGPVELAGFGAFVTNPISLERRTPARGQRFAAFAGGFLLHTGYPNPGLKAVLRKHAAQWARSPLPVIVHLMAGKLSEPGGLQHLSEMVRLLERVEGVLAVEVGLPPDVDVESARAYARAASGELPVILRLPFEQALELAYGLASAPSGVQGWIGMSALEVGDGWGISAISLAPPRGAVSPAAGELLHGRLYGPALFPLCLERVHSLAQAGLPVIASGGITRPQQVEAMLSAGTIAVQVDSALWRGW